MMAWQTRNNNSTIPEAACWYHAELEASSTEFLNLNRPETSLMSPSPDFSTITRIATAQPPSYNCQLQPPSTPAAFGAMLLPLHPFASYLDPSTIKRSIDNLSPRSVPTPALGAVPVLSPASPYDAGCPSPWDDLPVSTPIIKETPQSDETIKGPRQSKGTCRPRPSAAKIKNNEHYGTWICPWKDCKQNGRPFSRKGVLKRHIDTQHVNPRAFKCPHARCTHASSRRENLKAHRQSIHKETL
ncbi:uncharacterized protein N7479_000599 [Penicillium vulpinum]|nr:uncharacterized protein N7479_000599 [Penicillium vulpinum]KAJ5970681.1 hypothetical protein N7479_000599 [Penicillium vulpinum]